MSIIPADFVAPVTASQKTFYCPRLPMKPIVNCSPSIARGGDQNSQLIGYYESPNNLRLNGVVINWQLEYFERIIIKGVESRTSKARIN